jgi:hypothetical protein
LNPASQAAAMGLAPRMEAQELSRAHAAGRARHKSRRLWFMRHFNPLRRAVQEAFSHEKGA